MWRRTGLVAPWLIVLLRESLAWTVLSHWEVEALVWSLSGQGRKVPRPLNGPFQKLRPAVRLNNSRNVIIGLELFFPESELCWQTYSWESWLVSLRIWYLWCCNIHTKQLVNEWISSVLTPLGPWSRLAFDYLVLIPGRNPCLLLCFHSSLSHLEPEPQWGTLVNDLVIYSAQMIHRLSWWYFSTVNKAPSCHQSAPSSLSFCPFLFLFSTLWS